MTYSRDQQIFKFKVSSGSNQDIWGVYIDFQSVHSKCTIYAILQLMGSFATTEYPNVMMRENHNTHEDKLYIVSITPQEILHTLQDKYKINIIYKINVQMILVEEIFVNVNSRNVLKCYMSTLICYFQ